MDKKLEEIKSNSFSGDRNYVSAIDIIIFSEISLILALGNHNPGGTTKI